MFGAFETDLQRLIRCIVVRKISDKGYIHAGCGVLQKRISCGDHTGLDLRLQMNLHQQLRSQVVRVNQWKLKYCSIGCDLLVAATLPARS